MKDERRKQLDNRLTPIHLFKLTPKTNCGKCGTTSCFGFAAKLATSQNLPYFAGNAHEFRGRAFMHKGDPAATTATIGSSMSAESRSAPRM